MSRPHHKSPPGSPVDAGFTLIEVLASVAIAGIVLSAVASVVGVSLAAIRSAPERVALIEAGQTLLDSLPRGDDLSVGVTAGALGRMRWRIDVAPLGSAIEGARPTPDGAPRGWRAVSIVISATTPSGRKLRLETIGLVRLASS